MEKNKQYKIICGDALEALKAIPDESINCVITSPPYYGLRDYGAECQLGLEKTYQEYIARLIKIFDEVKRVLKSDGTCWVNLGDSYSNGRQSMQPKTLMQIPFRFAIAMTDNNWILRQDIIWHKPNPKPEPVRDRCTRAHEYIFMFAKSQKYYYDYDAIKEKATYDGLSNIALDRIYGRNSKEAILRGWNNCKQPKIYNSNPNDSLVMGDTLHKTEYRNKRSVWTINVGAFQGAHFAAFPEELVKPMILAGCPKGGVVLDPFSGAATTGLVAIQFNRKYIGIEINPEYVSMSEKRLNPHSNQLQLDM